MTELLLVRHGESVYNVQGRWQGWSDVPLSEKGIKEAKLIAQRLNRHNNIVAVYTSPLQRALETARFIGAGLGLEPIPQEGLKEANFGLVEGLTLGEFEERFPEAYRRWSDKTDYDFTWPGGEKRAAFFRRAAEAVRQIVDGHPEGSVVVVTHGGVIRAALAHCFPKEAGQWWAYRLNTGSITKIKVSSKHATLLYLNDHSHLLTL